MTEEQKTINKRFDELERLILKEDNKDIAKLNFRFDKLETDIEPIITWFGHMNWMKTGVLYTAGFVVTVGSAIFTLKSFWK